ncbi:MAG: ATP synthase F0 subunit B [Deltaproteobacteria bacterium]|nr:ATP synthase F0 subunit B [Deltaproteobacteria bacterium]
MHPDFLSLIITFATDEAHSFNWRDVAYQAVNLTILLLVLVYYLKQPIKNFLIERRGIIGNEIDDAQKAIAEAKKIHAEYEEKLKHLDSEITSLKESIQKQGEIERNEILIQAEIASEKIRGEARESIELETAKARRAIQSEAITLALEIAEGLIKQNLSSSDKNKITEDFVKRMDEEKWHQSQH